MIVQKNPRPFHFTQRGRTRGTQAFKALKFLRRENQHRKFGLSSHVPYFNMAMAVCKAFNETLYYAPTGAKIIWVTVHEGATGQAGSLHHKECPQLKGTLERSYLWPVDIAVNVTLFGSSYALSSLLTNPILGVL